MSQIFSFIINPMEWGLAHLAISVGSAGVAIILFTIIIRLILAPLTITQLRNARAMQRLQPHIKALRERHGKDKQKLTEETMRLYKEHKVNPAMGCLPMLLQFPVLIGLFYALRTLGESPKNGHVTASWLTHTYHYSLHVYTLYHADFLWLSHGLGKPDPLYILPVLAGVTQWIQSRMMLQRSDDPQQQTMNTIMNFTPLIIVFFATRYASGLSLYWVTSTVIGILVQYKITGWGLLNELATTFRRPAPQRALTSSKPRASRNGRGNGKLPTAADITLVDEPAEEPARGSMDGGTADGQRPSASRPSGRPPDRRRSGRTRGGRRR